MPIVIALATFGTAAPNPFAFEGRSGGFDPEHPGIAGLTRQPLLWALALWSGAHLIANGDLAHVILFGLFFLFSLAGMAIVEGRRRALMGDAAWEKANRNTGLVPFSALISGRWRPVCRPVAGAAGVLGGELGRVMVFARAGDRCVARTVKHADRKLSAGVCDKGA